MQKQIIKRHQSRNPLFRWSKVTPRAQSLHLKVPLVVMVAEQARQGTMVTRYMLDSRILVKRHSYLHPV